MRREAGSVKASATAPYMLRVDWDRSARIALLPGEEGLRSGLVRRRLVLDRGTDSIAGIRESDVSRQRVTPPR